MKQKKEIESSLKLLVKTSAIVFLGVMLSKVFTIAYRIAIARTYGPEAYGLFSLASIVLIFFASFFFLGLNEGVLRQISFFRGKNDKNKIKYLFRLSAVLLLISSIFGGIILFVFSNQIAINFFHNSSLAIYLQIFSILVPISVLSDFFMILMRAYEKVQAYSFFYNIFSNGIRFAFLLVFILAGAKSDSAIIFSYFTGIILTLVLGYIYCRYKIPEIFMRYNLRIDEKKTVNRDLFAYSWPIFVYALFGNVLVWIDSLAVGYFNGVANAGFYSVAVTLSSLLMIAPSLFIQLFFPLITREFSRKNFVLIKELSKQVNKWIMILNIPIFMLIATFPGVLIRLFFGAEFFAAVLPLRILAVSGFISSLLLISNNLVSVIGKTRLTLKNAVISSALNIFLNIILVPRFGTTGAALSSGISVITFYMLFFFQAKKYTSVIPFRKKMINIFIISIIPLLFLVIAQDFIEVTALNIIILGIIFLPFYVVLIAITGCLDRNDLMILKAVKTRIAEMSGKTDNNQT